MKYEPFRQTIADSIAEMCHECGLTALREQALMDADEYFMPRLIPLLEAWEKQRELSI